MALETQTASAEPSASSSRPHPTSSGLLAADAIEALQESSPSAETTTQASTRLLSRYVDNDGELTADAMRLLKLALPGGGEAIAKLAQRQSISGRILRTLRGSPETLKGERFAAFMVKVHSDVKAVAKRAELSGQDAAELMRVGVCKDTLGTKLRNADKARMMFALYAIREKYTALPALTAALGGHPAFKRLPAHEAWRLLMDHSAWGDDRHEGLRFENEPGYMGGMYRGLTAMINADLAGRRLDANLCLELHDECTAGVFKRNANETGNRHDPKLIAGLTSRAAVKRLAEEGDPNIPTTSRTDSLGRTPPDLECIEQGYRKRSVTFSLEPGSNLSEAGLREMLATYNHEDRENRPFSLFTMGGGLARPRLRDMVSPEIEKDFSKQGRLWLVPSYQTDNPWHARASMTERILEGYATQIAQAREADDKLGAIARCCQDLERSHPFRDGNARTFGFLALNKLLLENGMSPAMFENPNRFDGFSCEELVEEIKRGQDIFSRYCTQP